MLWESGWLQTVSTWPQTRHPFAACMPFLPRRPHLRLVLCWDFRRSGLRNCGRLPAPLSPRPSLPRAAAATAAGASSAAPPFVRHEAADADELAARRRSLARRAHGERRSAHGLPTQRSAGRDHVIMRDNEQASGLSPGEDARENKPMDVPPTKAGRHVHRRGWAPRRGRGDGGGVGDVGDVTASR
eukprot:358539-Chlamydomonas_euryale.AAC.2